jgi:hypothetical protein
LKLCESAASRKRRSITRSRVINRVNLGTLLA